MPTNLKTEQIIWKILRAGNPENQPLIRSSGLPRVYSGTLPPPRNPKGQLVRAEKRGAGGLSGASGTDVHHEKGAVFGQICVWPPLRVKKGKGSKVRFSPKNKGFPAVQ